MPSGIYKRTKKRGGWKLSEETKRKMIENSSKYWLGKKRPEMNNHKWNLGIKRSIETKLKMRSSAKKGEKNNKWKGDKVGYFGLHDWINYYLGKPCKCEHCKKETTNSRQFHWANKSGKYLRDFSDWIRLCVPCHHKFDNMSEKSKKTRDNNL